MTTHDTYMEEIEGDSNLVQSAAALGTVLAGPTVITPEDAGKPHVFVVPDGYKVKTETFEEHGARPARAKGRTIVVRDEDSLIALAKRTGPHPVVYADPVNQSIVCILNDDVTEDTPGWRDSRVSVELVQTGEWQAWVANNGKFLPQAAFADFIEDHYRTIVHPSAADMLEIAQSLEASTGLRVKSSVRLRDGQRKIVYEEDTTARAGFDGELTIPEEIAVELVPWRGRDDVPIPLTARLRFRTGGGNVTMCYIINDLDRAIERAFGDITAKITDAGIEVITGRP